MGNINGSNIPRERHKSGSSDLIMPGSPAGQALFFDKKPEPRFLIPDEPYNVYAKSAPKDQFLPEQPQRQRSSTLSESSITAAEKEACEVNEANESLPTVFKWEGTGGKPVKQVLISGTFSEWKPLPMVKSHDNFVTIIDLPEGDHEYKFCVDGEWKHDPKLKNILNDVGTKNNLVSVRRSDFEVFEALAKDSEDTGTNEQKEYSQDIPTTKPWEKISGPPVLPPHLLQVILNKDTPLSCEPTLLPEPNHVMLNHLYALSIKDGVMVLSATHRYRKKYVTTLLYKPI